MAADMEVTVDVSQLERFAADLERLGDDARRGLCETVAKDLAKRMLAKVIHKTPVGQYPKGSGKVGGTLRRGWTTGPVERSGDTVSVDVHNDVEYAPYVEYGHRARGGRSWVEGRFMMTRSADELVQEIPGIAEQSVERYLEGLE